MLSNKRAMQESQNKSTVCMNLDNFLFRWVEVWRNFFYINNFLHWRFFRWNIVSMFAFIFSESQNFTCGWYLRKKRFSLRLGNMDEREHFPYNGLVLKNFRLFVLKFGMDFPSGWQQLTSGRLFGPCLNKQ